MGQSARDSSDYHLLDPNPVYKSDRAKQSCQMNSQPGSCSKRSNNCHDCNNGPPCQRIPPVPNTRANNSHHVMTAVHDTVMPCQTVMPTRTIFTVQRLSLIHHVSSFLEKEDFISQPPLLLVNNHVMIIKRAKQAPHQLELSFEVRVRA